VHSLYYSGDLLIFYATFGLGLIALRKVSDKSCFILSMFLLAIPLHLFYIARALTDLAYVPPQLNGSWPLWGALSGPMADGSFLELSKAYITTGLKANIMWTWEVGRMFHIPGLFLLGMLAARRRVFTDMASWRWGVLLGVALAVFIPLHIANARLADWVIAENQRNLIGGLLASYGDVAFMIAIVSAFVLLWRAKVGEKLFSFLIPYGRMSLTNYLTQGVTGVILYNGCGFGLHHYFGSTMSAMTGVVILILQLWFSRWCLNKWGQGPLELVWRKLMWLGHKAPAKE
jgi:uncharacterized protein